MKVQGGERVDKWIDLDEAVKLIQTGDRLLVGGFGLSGSPLSIIDRLVRHDVMELTIISNNLGIPDAGLGKLLKTGQIKKIVGSYFTTNRDVVKAWERGEFEIELVPQGTLAEAIRAAGAGIGGFYTKTAVGTRLAEGKEHRQFNGETYMLQEPLHAEVALIKAWKADRLGNLIYYKAANNFNQVMATAGRLVIAEVDEIVETGELSPEEIQTPHAYVDYIVKSTYVKKGGRYVAQSENA